MIGNRSARMRKLVWRGLASAGLSLLGMFGLSEHAAAARQSTPDSQQGGSATNAQTQLAQCHCTAIYGVRG